MNKLEQISIQLKTQNIHKKIEERINKKITTRNQDLVNQICDEFNDRKYFGMWCGIVTRLGFQEVYDKFKIVKGLDKDKRTGKYLMGCLKKT